MERWTKMDQIFKSKKLTLLLFATPYAPVSWSLSWSSVTDTLLENYVNYNI